MEKNLHFLVKSGKPLANDVMISYNREAAKDTVLGEGVYKKEMLSLGCFLLFHQYRCMYSDKGGVLENSGCTSGIYQQIRWLLGKVLASCSFPVCFDHIASRCNGRKNWIRYSQQIRNSRKSFLHHGVHNYSLLRKFSFLNALKADAVSAWASCSSVTKNKFCMQKYAGLIPQGSEKSQDIVVL